MADNVYEFRPKAGDTEKITINLGYVDLGHIDLLVQEGFYSNRTDFIRTAIRNQIERHADAAKQSVAAKERRTGPAPLQPRRPGSRAGRRTDACRSACWGWPASPQDVTPELARATIGSVEVLGAFHASPAVKAALRDRIR